MEQYAICGGSMWLKAIDYKTDEIKWSHAYTNADTMGGSQAGRAYWSTAAGLLFSGDFDGNLIAFQAGSGESSAFSHAALPQQRPGDLAPGWSPIPDSRGRRYPIRFTVN